MDQQPPAIVPAASMSPMGFVVGLHDFTAYDDALTLSFKSGDRITVYATTPSGWWDGSLNDKRGWFPSNFTTALNEEKPTKPVWITQTSKSGKFYYYNTLTGQSVWEKPADYVELSETQQQNSSAHAAAAATPENVVIEPPPNSTMSLADDDEDAPPNSTSSTPASTLKRNLPSGWTVHESSDGKEFYYNKDLQKASWTVPVEEKDAPAPNTETDPLPQNWGEKKLPDGRVYYYNRVTNDTTWSRADVFSAPAKPQEPVPSKMDEVLAIQLLGKSGKQDAAWESVFNGIIKVFVSLNDASKNNQKQLYIGITKRILAAITSMLKAAGTFGKNSEVLRQHKILGTHQRELRDNLDKLVLAAKLASAIWPAPDSVVRMQQIASDMMVAARNYISSAIELGITIDPSTVALPAPKRNISVTKLAPVIPLPSLVESVAEIHIQSPATPIRPNFEATDAADPELAAAVSEEPSTKMASPPQAQAAPETPEKAILRHHAESMNAATDSLVRASQEAEMALRRISQFDDSESPGPMLARARRTQSMDTLNANRLSGYNRSTSMESIESSDDDAFALINKLDHFSSLVLLGVQELVNLVKMNSDSDALIEPAKAIVGNSGQILEIIDEIRDPGHEQEFADCKKNLADTVTGLDYSIHVASDPLAPSDAYKRIIVATEALIQSVNQLLVITKESISRMQLPEEDELNKTLLTSNFRHSESMDSISDTFSNASTLPDEDEDLDFIPRRKNSKNLNQLLGENNAKLNKFFGENISTENLNISPSKPAVPKFLSEDFSPQHLIFNMEGKVKAGTPLGLVEYLTSHSRIDTDFLGAFLLTYRSFTTTEELLKLLRNRFQLKAPEGLNEAEMKEFSEKKLTPVRLRVINVLKTWIENYYGDFAKQELTAELNSVISEIKAVMPNPAETLTKLLTKKNTGTITKKMIFSGKTPLPVIGKKDNIKFLDTDAFEIAKQFTILESQMYNKIQSVECLNKGWSKDAKNKSDAPNIRAMINQSNMVTAWVVETILKEKNLRTRMQVLKQFIHIADKCRQLNNFNTMMSVLAGLDSAPIHRLQRTWLSLSEKHMKTLRSMRELMDSTSNFNNYRKTLHSINPPCVPFLGLYLTDLTFIEDGNKDYINKMINFDKRFKCAVVIREIQQYQVTPYCLQAITSLCDWLVKSINNTSPIENMYQLSLEREPRESGEVLVLRTLAEHGLF